MTYYDKSRSDYALRSARMKTPAGKTYYKKSPKYAHSAGVAKHEKATRARVNVRAKTPRTASVIKVVKRKRRG